MAVFYQIQSLQIACFILLHITSSSCIKASPIPDENPSQRNIPGIYQGRYINAHFVDGADFSKIDATSLKKLANLEGNAQNKSRDIREWLVTKIKEQKEAETNVTNVEFSTTLIGNISQDCYYDVITLVSDFETYQPYALKSKFEKYVCVYIYVPIFKCFHYILQLNNEFDQYN